jgi:hypothetical protein
VALTNALNWRFVTSVTSAANGATCTRSGACSSSTAYPSPGKAFPYMNDPPGRHTMAAPLLKSG